MIKFCLKFHFSQTVDLHPYLLANLKRRGLYPLKKFQIQSIETVKDGHNFFLNSCTGSGKTLSYLVPIMNSILIKQDDKNATPPHGSVILTLNKQLVAQVYRQIRDLDIENRLKVYRTGTLSQQRLKAESKPEDRMSEGLTNLIFWNQIDILISTPQALMNQLTIYKAQAKSHIDPQFLAIDEADLVLEIDKNVRTNADKAIKYIREHSTKSNQIKYMLAASSFPKRFRGADAKEKLSENFKVLKFIDGENRHKLPQKLQLFYIEMVHEDQQKLLAQKLMYLKRILNDRQKERIIIFCKEKATINSIHKFIEEEISSNALQYYAELKSEERAAALCTFDEGKCNILISSELGSRGLDFTVPIDCIIEFNMAENVTHFINRAGRTARNGLYGQVITFVEKKNQQFFTHLRTLKEQGSEFDELFSRKRSYSKLYKESNEG